MAVGKGKISAVVMTRPEPVGVGTRLSQVRPFLGRVDSRLAFQKIVEEENGAGRIAGLDGAEANGWPGLNELGVHGHGKERELIGWPQSVLGKPRRGAMDEIASIEEADSIRQRRITNRRHLIQFRGQRVVPDIEAVGGSVGAWTALDLAPIIDRDLSQRLVAFARNPSIIVFGVMVERDAPLSKPAEAFHLKGLLPGPRQRREEQESQEPKNRDDNQELDQREATAGSFPEGT